MALADIGPWMRTAERPFLEELYRSHSRSVLKRARTIMGDGDDAKDAMQEVFLRAFEADAELVATASPLSWLYRITTNICLNRIRDSGRRRGILDRRRSHAVSVSETTHDEALTVRTLLTFVPLPVQEIAVLYFVDQMSQDEIAIMLKIPRRTVGYRLLQFRALASAAAQDPQERGDKKMAAPLD